MSVTSQIPNPAHQKEMYQRVPFCHRIISIFTLYLQFIYISYKMNFVFSLAIISNTKQEIECNITIVKEGERHKLPSENLKIGSRAAHGMLKFR